MPNNIALKLGRDEDGDLTSLDWNATGTLLAIGCYDHKVRVITSNGLLHMEGAMHKVFKSMSTPRSVPLTTV